MASHGSAVLQHELDISTKISNLEKKASKLEFDFNEMLNAVQEMELAVKKYVKKAETEQKSTELLEKIMGADTNLSDVMDHVRIFFNFILAKMKLQRADITDVNMLWHLIDCDGVSRCFSDVLLQCGFSSEDMENMSTLSAVVSRLHVDLESEDTSINPGTKSGPKNQDIDGQTDLSRNSDNGGTESVDNSNKFDVANTNSGTNQEYVEKVDDITDTQTERHVNHTTTRPIDLSNLKETHVSIRESLKKMKFVDIDGDMKRLIENIVCYVTKIRFE